MWDVCCDGDECDEWCESVECDGECGWDDVCGVIIGGGDEFVVCWGFGDFGDRGVVVRKVFIYWIGGVDLGVLGFDYVMIVWVCVCEFLIVEWCGVCDWCVEFLSY